MAHSGMLFDKAPVPLHDTSNAAHTVTSVSALEPAKERKPL